MRSIASQLTTAQKEPSRVPYVPVVVTSKIGPFHRYDMAMLDATANTADRHDACLLDNGTLIRYRITGGAVKVQRNVDPGVGTWTWTTDLVTGMGARVGASAHGTRAMCAYTNAAGTDIRFRESTDSGATYSADALVVAVGSVVKDLAVAYKASGGDCAIVWINTANNVQIIKRTSGTWGSVATWPHSMADGNGIALAYGGDYNIVITGSETTTTRATVWTLVYGDGDEVTAGNWSSLYIQVQMESALGSFSAPFLALTDVFRMTFVESPSYTGGIRHIYRSMLHPQLLWLDGKYTWRSPTIAADTTDSGGMALAFGQPGVTYVYESALDRVQRAARALTTLDVTADVLALSVAEATDDAHGWIDLDNASGLYAGPPTSLAIGNNINIGFGYYTTAGNQSSSIQDLWIAGLEHRREGGVSILRLLLESGWHMLRRSYQRTAIVHTADSLAAIYAGICARAGLAFETTGQSSRAGAIVPPFTIPTTTSGYVALQQVLSFLADRCYMLTLAELRMTEPLAGDSSDYALGSAHAIHSLTMRQESAPAASVQAFGAAAYGEAIDNSAETHGLSARRQLRDLTSDAAAEAAATAVAHLRQRKLGERSGSAVVPPVCGLELLDVVGITDGYVNIDEQLRRVMAIVWRFDKRRARYEQELTLGPR